jgi:DNA modification methylase
MQPPTPLRLEYRRIADLASYDRPLRKYSRAVGRMRASIREYGCRIPILIRGNTIVDGHLRVKALVKEGYIEVPVILCDDWNDAQVKAFRLMANRSATWAQFDLDMVALEIQELQGLDFDLDLTGFDRVEIDRLLFGDQAVPDAKEPPGDPVTRLGDLWLLDRHRTLCGDATNQDATGRLFQSAIPALMVTDPPYGISLDPTWRERAGLGQQRQTGRVPNDDRADWSEALKHFRGDVAYVFHSGLHSGEVAVGLEACGLRIRAQIIWVKQNFAIGRGDFQWQHEPAYYCVREGKRSNWCGDRTQSTVWEIENLNPFGGSSEDTATGHGTQKPLELMRRPILNNSRRGDIIYDPFLGSGTLLVAAQLTDRICYGIDIDPHYMDVIVRRWQTLTGHQATLENDGRTFDQIAEERHSAAAMEEESACPDPN